MPRLPTPEDIDAILPQTQCGLCGHGGCMPYAEALVYEQAAINLCPPGGVPVLHKIGKLMQQDPSAHEHDMRVTAKPKLLAVIRENECIGCTKCIQACPVDAILGSAKTMHTVISNECTGCELCIAPCPVDCIDLVEISSAKINASDEINLAQSSHYRARFIAHEQRLKRSKIDHDEKEKQKDLRERNDYVKAALERVRSKKTGTA